MLKVLTKNTIIIFLLVLSGSQSVCAGVDVYRYDGKLPFIKMMLGMMDAMGVIDKLPANGAYGGNRYSRYSNNPMLRSPWLQSPWSTSGQYGSSGVSPIWGSPDWGVLPVDRYTRNYYSEYGYGYQPYWSQSEMDGWVDEPWENSEWNSRAGSRPIYNARPVQPLPQQPNNTPLVQNFNFGLPENNMVDNRPANRSPLAKLARPPQQDRRPARPPARPPPRSSAGPSAGSPVMRQGNPSPQAKKRPPNLNQKPCVTEFCGLKKPNLNGLWVSQDGEVLGINNHRYLWNDGSSRYLTGQMKVHNEYLIANVDDHEKIMRFKYKLAGNHLLTMQPDGTIREFNRMSRSEYQRLASSRNKQNYGRNYGQKYGQSRTQNYGRSY